MVLSESYGNIIYSSYLQGLIKLLLFIVSGMLVLGLKVFREMLVG